ncbi:MAG: cobyrinate a,c-diamide synthase [Rhizobiaceae bacterium]|nr:cobyrinate a,c-diamide synthase [Rhizobiaceae bacterium]
MTGKIPSILIAAARKSSGKTTISLGLAKAYQDRGLQVQTFKKGPDYIDPLWLQRASGRPCYNLDFNTQTPEEISATFSNNLTGVDLAIVETNKGLYDGVDLYGSDSNAQLAKLLKTPIILVIDTVGITRGIAPLLNGLTSFDPDIKISGVILNKTGGLRHEEKLRAAVEHYTDVRVLGAVGRNADLAVKERHLGLTTPQEKTNALPLIDRLADSVKQNVDLDAIFEIAKTSAISAPTHTITKTVKPDITIAIPRDRAFGFYYEDDLETFKRAGAELVFFSTLGDEKLPLANGLFIGGGFPENHTNELQANQALRAHIKSAINNGLPTYAECGGLMYLSRSIEWNGDKAQMVGAIQGDCQMHIKPQGRGFTRLQPTGNHPWISEKEVFQIEEFRAHEFHYASINNLPADTRYAYKVARGHGINGKNDGIIINNLLANFCHLRSTKQSAWVEWFVDFVRKRKGINRI